MPRTMMTDFILPNPAEALKRFPAPRYRLGFSTFLAMPSDVRKGSAFPQAGKVRGYASNDESEAQPPEIEGLRSGKASPFRTSGGRAARHS